MGVYKAGRPSRAQNKNNTSSTTRRRRKVDEVEIPTSGILTEDQALVAISHVQIKREPTSFRVSSETAPMIRNIIKDAELVFSEKRPYGDAVRFELKPRVHSHVDEVFNSFEEYEDEILDEGIF